jgi:hypothetical protein
MLIDKAGARPNRLLDQYHPTKQFDARLETAVTTHFCLLKQIGIVFFNLAAYMDLHCGLNNCVFDQYAPRLEPLRRSTATHSSVSWPPGTFQKSEKKLISIKLSFDNVFW